MKKLTICIILLAMLLTGCRQENAPQETRPTETEPVIVHDWSAEGSPIPVKRVGVVRAGLGHSDAAVSPTGVYYLYTIPNILGETPPSPVILYVDYGSDAVIKLCGRPDCTHDTKDCNAYVEGGKCLSYYEGYLYVISEVMDFSGIAGDNTEYIVKLLRMDPDGTNRVEIFDLQKFAKDNGCDYALCEMITDGYCLLQTYKWKDSPTGGLTGSAQATYYYKLDGSMEQPEKVDAKGMILYNCGDVILTYHPSAENGGQFGSYWDWDPETDSLTYLTDHPGEPGWFGETEAYYFKDGAVRRLTYATGQEEVVIQTELQGDYYACCFPDCIVVVSNSVKDTSDKNLYIYNWDFEHVATVSFEYSGKMLNSKAILGETADKILLTKSHIYPVPTHYINKSELGSENVQVHEFDLTAIDNMIETVKKYYPDAPW